MTPLQTLPRWRLTLLRLAYLILALGLGLTVWPALFDLSAQWTPQGGVIKAMLGAIGLIAALGLWRPLETMPLLLFELAWKLIWMLRIALPAWLDGTMDTAIKGILWECLPILPIALLIPWDHVWRTFRYGSVQPGV